MESVETGRSTIDPHPPHSVLLQATGGMCSFLRQFSGCLQLLRELPPAPAPAAASGGRGGGDTAMSEAAGAQAAPAGEPAELAAYRQTVEATVGTFLVLMTNMRCALRRWGRCAARCAAPCECAASAAWRRPRSPHSRPRDPSPAPYLPTSLLKIAATPPWSSTHPTRPT